MRINLITGAAGLVGGELAAALARRGEGVIGLCRNNMNLGHGDQQSLDCGDWLGEPPVAGEILLVRGDVALPDLGLAPDDYAALQAQTDMVFHCAAHVQFDAASDIYDAVNVGGTRHLLAFAATCQGTPAGFVHVSTAFVCGEREAEISEIETGRPASFANAYEASKFDAEELVRNAMAKGMRAAIARPSIIVGQADTGMIASFDTIYMAFKLLSEGRIRTIPAHADGSLNFVPIDHVINGLLTIADKIDEASGKAFHLVASRPMPVPEFFDLIGDYRQFSSPEVITPGEFDPDRLSASERRFHRKVAVLYTSYFQRNPLFSSENLIEFSGRTGPAADRALMRRQIDYAIRAGFLRAESIPA